MKNTALIIVIYNTADFITKQIETIRRFCKDDLDIIIIDNSTDKDVSEALRYRIRDFGCIYEKTQAASGDPSLSHAFAANFAYGRYRDSYEYMFYLDHDAFVIKDFSVKEILGDKVMAGMAQTKPSGKTYLWPGCLLLNNTIIDKNLVDFSPNIPFGLDTGGNLYKLFDQYGKDRIVFFNEYHHENIHFKRPYYNVYSIIGEDQFLHFIAGSNWQKLNDADHTERISTLMAILEEKLSNG